MRVCAWVQIPVCPEPPLVFSLELLGGLRTGCLVASPLRVACVFLHVKRGRSSNRVWRTPRIIYLFISDSSQALTIDKGADRKHYEQSGWKGWKG
jgi:hypothetical protein